MKNLLLIGMLLLISIGSKAQTVDTTNQEYFNILKKNFSQPFEKKDTQVMKIFIYNLDTNRLTPQQIAFFWNEVEKIRVYYDTNFNRIKVQKYDRDQRLNLVHKYKMEYDEFKKTWYVENKPIKLFNNLKTVYGYFGMDKDYILNTPLFLHIDYYAEHWLFIESYILLIDGDPFPVKPYKVHRLVAGGGWVKEYCSVPLFEDNEKLINILANCKELKIRYIGDRGVSDKIVSKSDLEYLQEIFRTFQRLN